MFVNPKEINKLIKAAYKAGGITVARTEGRYIITPGAFTWTLQAEVDELDNKIKACIMELGGMLPEEGRSLKLQKEQDPYLDDEVPAIMPTHPMEIRGELIIRNLVVTDRWNYYRILEVKNTGAKIPITDSIMAIIDKHIDTSGDAVTGPYISMEHSQRATWSNCTGVFSIAMASYGEDSEMATLIESLEDCRI